MGNSELIKLIGELEMMVAATEPGLVITEGMSVFFCVALLKAVESLKKGT